MRAHTREARARARAHNVSALLVRREHSFAKILADKNQAEYERASVAKRIGVSDYICPAAGYS